MKQDTIQRIILASLIFIFSIFLIFIAYQTNDSELFQRTAVNIGSVPTYPIKFLSAMSYLTGIIGIALGFEILIIKENNEGDSLE